MFFVVKKIHQIVDIQQKLREKWCVLLFVPTFQTRLFPAFLKESAYLQERRTWRMSSTKIIEEVKSPKDESSNQVANKNSYLYFRMRFSHECTLMQPDEWIVWSSKKLVTFCWKAIKQIPNIADISESHDCFHVAFAQMR